MRHKILLIILLMLTHFSCKKRIAEPLKFPDETQEGKNTFACYVDGKEFIAVMPAITVYSLHPITANYYTQAIDFYKAGSLFVQGIDATVETPADGSIAIQKMNLFGTGDFPLSYIDSCTQPYTCDASFFYNYEVGNYFAQNGKLTITRLDTLNKIVAGRFYFTAKDTLGNKIEITNGRFDIKYFN